MLRLLAIILAIGPTITHAQSWVYRSTNDGTTTLRGTTTSSPGYITLDESSGTPIFTMVIPNPTECFRGPIPAKVDRTAETTNITVKKDLKGCFSVRFVIKNDGSGGRRELLKAGKWTWDEVERGLTPRNP